MFGEGEVDDARPGSPWDTLLSSSPSIDNELKTRLRGTPKLEPEIEEGNVEYKLKLVDPTPERFMRLVTQLKWRLLEGSGQAYYELGVADSGQLIGLARADLEASLETLEAMAGEIGASVIIVKEIEVARALGTVRTVREGPVGGRGGVDFSRVDGSMRLPRRRVPPLTSESDESDELATPSDLDVEIAAVFKPLPSLRRPPPAEERRPSSQKQRNKPPVDAAARASSRRLKRDQRREERRRMIEEGLLPHIVPTDATPTEDLAAGLAMFSLDDPPEAVLVDAAAIGRPIPADTGPPGPRLIVEALVVRKLTADEAFLDLGGFML